MSPPGFFISRLSPLSCHQVASDKGADQQDHAAAQVRIWMHKTTAAPRPRPHERWWSHRFRFVVMEDLHLVALGNLTTLTVGRLRGFLSLRELGTAE